MHTDANITPLEAECLFITLFQSITKHPQKFVDVSHFVFLHSQFEGFSSPLLKMPIPFCLTYVIAFMREFRKTIPCFGHFLQKSRMI